MILSKKILISIGVALSIICIIKFAVISESLYTPNDLKQAWIYIDKIIDLGVIDDGSCSDVAIKARNDALIINSILDGIIKAHKNEHKYLSITNAKANLDVIRSEHKILCTTPAKVPSELP